MQFIADVDTSLLNRRISQLIEAAVNPATALLRCGGVLRASARRRFAEAGPGWAPLAAATVARKPNEAMLALFTKGSAGSADERSPLQRIARAAKGVRLWSAKTATIEEHLAAARDKGRKTATLEGRRDRALTQQRRYLDQITARRALIEAAGIKPSAAVALAEREAARQKAHGAALRALRARKKSGELFTVEEQRALSRKHKRRFDVSPESAQVLGRLSLSIAMKLLGTGAVKVFSRAFIGAIHNYGGTAGHGAEIPARPFLYIVARDVGTCAGILSEFLVDEWRR